MNKQLDFPLANKINEETGVIYFTNEMQNGIIHIDKIGLEDWIAFHEAAYEIIDGYYYNSGRKNEINNVIKSLYDLRLKLKMIRTLHKLILNCWWIVCMEKLLPNKLKLVRNTYHKT